MTPNDRVEFVTILNGLAILKPGGTSALTKPALAAWWDAMHGWSLADFRAAANELAHAMEFMPGPFHFDQLRKAARITAPEAWEIARKAAGSAIVCGQVTHSGTCGDELIDRVVHGIGGYSAIAMCDVGKLPFLERRFAEHYATMQDAADIRAALPNLIDQKRLTRLESSRETQHVESSRQAISVAEVLKQSR